MTSKIRTLIWLWIICPQQRLTSVLCYYLFNFFASSGGGDAFGESGPLNSTSYMLFLLTLKLESLGLNFRLRWSYARKANLQQKFPWPKCRCWPAPGMFSTEPWNIVLGFNVASYRWRVLQRGLFVGVEWECKSIWKWKTVFKQRRSLGNNTNSCK